MFAVVAIVSAPAAVGITVLATRIAKTGRRERMANIEQRLDRDARASGKDLLDSRPDFAGDVEVTLAGRAFRSALIC